MIAWPYLFSPNCRSSCKPQSTYREYTQFTSGRIVTAWLYQQDTRAVAIGPKSPRFGVKSRSARIWRHAARIGPPRKRHESDTIWRAKTFAHSALGKFHSLNLWTNSAVMTSSGNRKRAFGRPHSKTICCATISAGLKRVIGDPAQR